MLRIDPVPHNERQSVRREESSAQNVARPENECTSSAHKAQIVGADLDDVADQLITEHDKRINVA